MNGSHFGRTLSKIVVLLLLVLLVGGAGEAREPLPLATVGDAFAAPYDAVWDATLQSLAAFTLRVTDKAAGRIETEPMVFTYTVGEAPVPSRGLLQLAAARPGGDRLAQSSGARPTQAIWFSMSISLIRAAEGRTAIQVEPRIHDALLQGLTPGPTNNPWSDLFARIHSRLGGR